MTQASEVDPWRVESKMKKMFESGYSQEQMAEKWGCSQSTISDWKNRHGIEMDMKSI